MNEARYRVEAKDVRGSTETYYTSREPRWYDQHTLEIVVNGSTVWLVMRNHISVAISKNGGEY